MMLKELLIEAADEAQEAILGSEANYQRSVAVAVEKEAQIENLESAKIIAVKSDQKEAEGTLATFVSFHFDHGLLSKEQLYSAFGIATIKYFDLAQHRSKSYAFDFSRMLSLKGNTAVYINYAHTRIRSIKRRLFRLHDLCELDRRSAVRVRVPNTEEIDLDSVERSLCVSISLYPAVVRSAKSSLLPHQLCDYLFGLCQDFHRFYEECRVIGSEPHHLQKRLVICQAVDNVLMHALFLLGISLPPPPLFSDEPTK